MFESSVRSKTKSVFIIPNRDLRVEPQTTSAYDSWVKAIYSSILPNSTPAPQKSPDNHIAKETTNLRKRKSASVVTRTAQSPVSSADTPKNTSKKRNLEVNLPQNSSDEPLNKTPPSLKNKSKLEGKAHTMPKEDFSSGSSHHLHKKLASPMNQEKGEDNAFTKTKETISLSIPSSLDDYEGENILDLFENIHEDDNSDSIGHLGLQEGKNLDAELRASNFGFKEDLTLDQDLIDSMKNPDICQAISNLSDGDDANGAEAQETNEAEAQETNETPFDCQSLLLQGERRLIFSIADSLQERLLKSSLEDLPKYAKELEGFIKHATARNVDLSDFEIHVKNYLGSAAGLQSLTAEYWDKPSPSNKSEEILATKERLSAATSLEKQTDEEAKTIQKNIQDISSKEERLKQELADLDAKKKELSTSLTLVQSRHSEHVSTVKALSQDCES